MILKLLDSVKYISQMEHEEHCRALTLPTVLPRTCEYASTPLEPVTVAIVSLLDCFRKRSCLVIAQTQSPLR